MRYNDGQGAIPSAIRRGLAISVILTNPKTFLPLLLFMGFIFYLISLGFGSTPAQVPNTTYVMPATDIAASARTIGGMLIVVGIVLFVLINRGRIGF